MCPLNLMKSVLSAFHRLKGALIFTPIMQDLNWELPFEVICDTSDYAVGAVLGRRKDNKPYAIYHTSRTLDDAQMNYATTKK